MSRHIDLSDLPGILGTDSTEVRALVESGALPSQRHQSGNVTVRYEDAMAYLTQKGGTDGH